MKLNFMKILGASALVLLLLSSCSRISMVAKWADTIIVEMVDSKFDLNSKQKKNFRLAVDKALSQLKAEKIPLWATTFESWADKVEKNKFDDATNEQMWSWIQTELADLPKYAEAPMEALVDSLDKSNFEYYRKDAFDELALRKAKKNTPESRLRAEKDSYLSWVNFWHDDLNKEQEKVLSEYIKTSPFPLDLSWQQSEQRINDFYKKSGDKEALKDWLKIMLSKPEELRSSEYQNALLNWQTKLKVYISDLRSKLTDNQTKYFVQQLRKLARELRQLAP